MKVLITGGGGQLGRELLATAPADWVVLAPARAELDIGDAAGVSAAVASMAPDVIINTAAYTAVDQAEREPDRAWRVNADGAGHLADAARQAGARLIHISTDYVFDGAANTPYPPDQLLRPAGVYARSKAEAESRVLARAGATAVIVRTAWLYSVHGRNFVKTMLGLLGSRDQVNVVNDQIGSPTWARGLARALWEFARRPDLSGCYHWTDAGQCSWYDFSVAIQEEALALGMLESSCRVTPVPGSHYPTVAPRPAYSVLNKDSTWRALGMNAMHWRESLRHMLRELSAHEPG